MQIIRYPHPTLRYKSKAIRHVDSELQEIVQQMFNLMYEANGVGLAANQVDLPLRLFIMNSEGNAEEGEELGFINPILTQQEGGHLQRAQYY